MTKMRTLTLAGLVLLAGCAPSYSLVMPGTPAPAVGQLVVTPQTAWNRAPKGANDVALAQVWSRNGPNLDRIMLIGGVRGGESIVKPQSKAAAQVPKFEATMQPQDVLSLVETYYRLAAGSINFKASGLRPERFAGQPGFSFDYDYVLADDVARKGRANGAVYDGKLYLIVFDAAAMHYFDAAAPDVAQMVSGARIAG